MKTEILKLLRETDGYVSGQQISEQVRRVKDCRVESDPSASG